MKASITPFFEVVAGKQIEGYRVDWLNDEGTVNEGHDKATLAEFLDWCRKQDIGWWRAVGFSDEWIPIGEDKQP